MFATLLGTWPGDSSQLVNGEASNAQSSGLNERSNFGGEDVPPSASSTFIVRPENWPNEKVFIPPYFVPPGGFASDHRTRNVAERLQGALQRDVAAKDHTNELTHPNPNDNVDASLHGLRPLAPRKHETQPASRPAEPQTQPQLDLITHPPSPAPESADLQREREATWSDAARQAFQTMITAPGYVNRYRLTPVKYQRLLRYLQEPEVEPTYGDGSKDHQTKYQAAHWTLRDGKLYRKAEGKGGSGGSGLRRHLDVHEVWDVLTAEHLRSRHLGRDRLRKVLEKRFIGYTLQEIMFILRECRVCKGRERTSKDLETGRERLLEQEGLAQDRDATNRQGDLVREPETAPSDRPYSRKQTSNMMWF